MVSGLARPQRNTIHDGHTAALVPRHLRASTERLQKDTPPCRHGAVFEDALCNGLVGAVFPDLMEGVNLAPMGMQEGADGTVGAGATGAEALSSCSWRRSKRISVCFISMLSNR
eukprot:1851586-Amphidinium_carterae.1